MSLSPNTARLVAGFAKYEGEPRTAAAIADIVSAKYGVSVSTLKGPARDFATCRIRHELMALLVESGKSMPWVGKFLGGRDHTTVLYGVRKHHERLSEHTREAA